MGMECRKDLLLIIIFAWLYAILYAVVFYYMIRSLQHLWEKIVVILTILFTVAGAILVTIGCVDEWHNTKCEGESCTKQSECSPGLHCNGDNKCSSGVSGGTEGTSCGHSSDCNLGLSCKSDKCAT